MPSSGVLFLCELCALLSVTGTLPVALGVLSSSFPQRGSRVSDVQLLTPAPKARIGIPSEAARHFPSRRTLARRAGRFVCAFCTPAVFAGAPRALRRGEGSLRFLTLHPKCFIIKHLVEI